VTLWWSMVAVSALAVLAYVLAPLWRGVDRAGLVAHRQAVLAALRTERQQLDEERAAGRLDEAAYQVAVDELRARLLAEVGGGEEADSAPQDRSRAPGVAAAAAVAAVAVAGILYLWVGAPQWADSAKVAEVSAQARAAASGNAPFTPEQIRGLVARLADRLAENPNDLQGWRMLARSYMVLEDRAAVREAWAKLGSKIPDDSEVLVDWAELLAAAEGGFVPEAVQLIEKALAHQPPQPRALALAGAAASANGDPQRAIDYWTQLLPLTEGNREAQQAVQAAIAEERQKLAASPR